MAIKRAKIHRFAPMFLLVMGITMMPGGYMLSNVVDGVVANSIGTAITGIEEQGVPMVVNMMKKQGAAEALRQLRDRALPFTEGVVNATMLTKILWEAYDTATKMEILGITMGSMGGDVLQNIFFDYKSVLFGMFVFSEQLADNNMPAILGYAEWHNAKYGENPKIGTWTGTLIPFEMLPNPNEIIMWGNPANNGSITPGFVQDQDEGTGVMQFLDLIASAIGNETAQNAICAAYGLDNDEYWKLSRLSDYYYEYWVPTAIPLIVGALADPSSTAWEKMPQYRNMDTDQIAEMELLGQWANRSRYPDGMDFHGVDEGIPEGTYGFEIADVATGITLDVAKALWNESNPLALTNMDAMETWYEAFTSGVAKKQLLDAFVGLTPEQLDYLLTWLWDGEGSFSQHIVPILIQFQYGVTLDHFALHLLLEQWTNGTIMGMPMYDHGFALPLGDMIVYGLEIGYRGDYKNPGPERIVPTNISIESAEELWRQGVDWSLANDAAMANWWAAVEDPTSDTAKMLQEKNGLTKEQMSAVLTWLPLFRDNVMPYLAQYQYHLPFTTSQLTGVLPLGGLALGAVCLASGSVLVHKNNVVKKTRDPSALMNTIDSKKKKKSNTQYKTVEPQGPPVTTPPTMTPPKSTVVTVLPQPVPFQVTPAPAESYVSTSATDLAKTLSVMNELAPPVATTPEDEQFFTKVMSGIKQLMGKIARNEFIDPLFASNLLYLLRTRRRKYEQQGDATNVKKVNEMYSKIEQLRDQIKGMPKI